MKKIKPDDLALTIRSRLEHEHKRLQSDILGSIRYLSTRLNQARADIENGEKIDPHLVANASMLTEAIARWNMNLDIGPLVEKIGEEP